MTTPYLQPASLWNKMLRAARLDVDFYEEVEADTTVTGQAFTVVLIAGLATGIGSGIAGFIENDALSFLWGLLLGVGTTVIGWLLWSMFAYWIGTALFAGPETKATYGELLRTLGFAHTPGVLRIFLFVPFIGGLIAFAASVWFLVAGVIAVRQALDFSTGRAIATCVVGWVIYMVFMFVVLILVNGVATLT